VSFRAATSTTHLGRYHVVKRLAEGGMADVLLARTDGIAGFERYVVIKRIHQQLLEEPRYVKMFLDEARLAASLHHHNIVQVNDIGEDNGEYFFAMEYVHGEDSRTLLVEASTRNEQIPLEHVIAIITAAAAGLHHAHEQRNLDGAALRIVHRDVSPANILVGYDGAVKVADFGIALAAHRTEHTQSGVLKGKVAYMSPEQCNCEPVDRRSDVFSLGIVLYELLTVRPCFAGDNDFLTMSAIVGGKLEKPSVFRKDLAPALEAIVLKALARKPEDRYQTAAELRVAIEQFAADAGLRTSTTALADYMKKQFGEKALPWQQDDVADDEPEISMHGDDLAVQGVTPVDDDDDLSVPVDVGSNRKPTLPLRALERPPAEEVVVGAPPSTRVDGGSVRAPTLAMRALDARPPANVIVGTASSSVARGVLGRVSARKLWLAASIVAFAIAALSLIVVTIGGDTPAPRASITPEARPLAPRPLERPTVDRAAVEAAPAPPVAPPPEKKPAKRERSKRKPAKTWDPDALFPQ
jgi:serine/threonine protein kinase